MNRKNVLPALGVLVANALLVPVVTRAQNADGMGTMSCCAPQQAGKKPTTAAVQAGKGGVQKATVTIDGGYSPSSLSVKAGKPVEITFVRKSAGGCDGELVIPALKFQKSLKQGEKTIVKFTPKKSQNIAFQCGMAMYKGQIAVQN